MQHVEAFITQSSEMKSSGAILTLSLCISLLNFVINLIILLWDLSQDYNTHNDFHKFFEKIFTWNEKSFLRVGPIQLLHVSWKKSNGSCCSFLEKKFNFCFLSLFAHFSIKNRSSSKLETLSSLLICFPIKLWCIFLNFFVFQ